MLQIKEFTHVTGVQVGISGEQECSLTIRYQFGASGPEQESPIYLFPREGLAQLQNQLQDAAQALDALSATRPSERH